MKDDLWVLTPEMAAEVLNRTFLASVSCVMADGSSQSAHLEMEQSDMATEFQEAGRVDALVESVSHGAGTTDALGCAIRGVLRVLAGVPGVRQAVCEELERAKALQLGCGTNEVMADQFDEAALLLRYALGIEPGTNPNAH